jgi:hypothetical protein
VELFDREFFPQVSNTWHHLLISYPGDGSDMNATRIFVDGKEVDSPSASVDGAVSTAQVSIFVWGRLMMIPASFPDF